MNLNYCIAILIVTVLFVCASSVSCTSNWPNHQVSTLRMLQLVHTHGDRTPSHFVHNDPYADVATFWREGIGQLTKLGRNRMFRIGKFFHDAYRNFLHDLSTSGQYMEKYLQVRSSGSRRCLESASALATGLIGGLMSGTDTEELSAKFVDYNNLTAYWRPIPVRSVFPKGTDPVLDFTPLCPNADSEFEQMHYNNVRLQRIYEENEEFFDEISLYAGEQVDTLKKANQLYQELFIESQYNYHWWQEPYQIWTENYETYAISKLRELSRLYWTVQFDNRLIQRLRGGGLIKEINANIVRYINGTDRERKIHIYSTHDSKIALLLQAFGVYNRKLIPPGASLVFELHHISNTNNSKSESHSIDDYYLKLYYFNETYTNDWAYELVPEKICQSTPEDITTQDNIAYCSVGNYLRNTAQFEPDDWQYECGLKVRKISYFVVNLSLFATNLILLAFFLILLQVVSSNMRKNSCAR